MSGRKVVREVGRKGGTEVVREGDRMGGQGRRGLTEDRPPPFRKSRSITFRQAGQI